VTSSAVNSTHPKFDLTNLLESIRCEAGIPALGGAVWYGDELVAMGATGVRRRGHTARVTVNDKWHLGSNTMAMTATLVGICADRGLVRLDDTLGSLFAGESIDPGYADVTLEGLLQHVGGMPPAPSPATMARMGSHGNATDARAELARTLLAESPARFLGAHNHSRAGYIVAAAALERASGDSWERLLCTNLFAPLGMTASGFGAPGAPHLLDQPCGHYATGKYFAPAYPGSHVESVWGYPAADEYLVFVPPGPEADDPPAFGPASTVHASLEDWGKFLHVHLRAARHEPTLVSRETMRRLQGPRSESGYACGWSITVEPWANGIVLGHGGSNGLWFSTAWILPGRNLVMAVVANAANGGASKAIENAFAKLVNIYVG